MKVSFIGFGNMGSAIAVGLLNYFGSDIELYAYEPDKKKHINSKVNFVEAPQELINIKSDVIIIAVKPQIIDEALKFVKDIKNENTLIPLWISIAAGVNHKKLSLILGEDKRIIRVMPNTPALVGEGISAYVPNENCMSNDIEICEKILSSFGSCIKVEEKDMDSVTGLSGSGPAYVYLFIEALAEAGVTAGLTYKAALKLAVQTVKGAAVMVEKSKESPSELKHCVMSPGGTTVEGLLELEKSAFKASVINAVLKAKEKSKELSA